MTTRIPANRKGKRSLSSWQLIRSHLRCGWECDLLLSVMLPASNDQPSGPEQAA